MNNRVTVTLKKKGDLLQVFVGQTKVAEYEKGIPPGLQFDAMSFDLSGNSASRMNGCSSATSGLRTTDRACVRWPPTNSSTGDALRFRFILRNPAPEGVFPLN